LPLSFIYEPAAGHLSQQINMYVFRERTAKNLIKISLKRLIAHIIAVERVHCLWLMTNKQLNDLLAYNTK